MNPCEQNNLNVQLYMDNELTGDDLQSFLDHLAGCASCKALLEEGQALKGLLHDSRPLFSASPELHARIAQLEREFHSPSEQASPGKHIWDRLSAFADPLRLALRWKPLVAATLVVALVLAFVPNIVEHARAMDYVEAAVATHDSYLNSHLPLEVQSGSPEAVSSWFAGKLPFHFELPSSQPPLGHRPAYELKGARLICYKGKEIALVAYETKQEKISLLVAGSDTVPVAGGEKVRFGGIDFHFRTTAGLNVITWRNHGLSYALVSSIQGSARQSCLVCHQYMADENFFKN